MPYMAYCLDKAGALEIRMANRPKHVEYLTSYNDKLLFAGPLLDEKEAMIGSLLVLDVADRAEMDKFLANDPYAKAGLFRSVSVHGVKKAFPK
ncbi:YciI family protein [Dongia sedimenti]|uniref:YciI family protein n=1 Tax=Dongia sedimenti TaxID=3064282 RepID=A0ABU0YMB1_9PROT|nr:YciI family protein [Rhodospirillaceae bacterium R-7]